MRLPLARILVAEVYSWPPMKKIMPPVMSSVTLVALEMYSLPPDAVVTDDALLRTWG
jgi:hypothetical protein